jgi:hypothetical protein
LVHEPVHELALLNAFGAQFGAIATHQYLEKRHYSRSRANHGSVKRPVRTDGMGLTRRIRSMIEAFDSWLRILVCTVARGEAAASPFVRYGKCAASNRCRFAQLLLGGASVE